MPKSQFFSPAYNRYIPAVLHRNKSMGWIIEYYAYNPVTSVLERKRIRLALMRQRYRTNAEFRQAANEIVCTINAQLAGGWSPFGETENVRYYTCINEVAALYITEKGKDLKVDTLRSYRSFCKIFCDWCDKICPHCKCVLFNHTLAVRYMDYVYLERKSSARTYNNQLKMARAFFAWAVEKCYCKENPFERIKVKKEAPKKRVIIPSDVREKIKQYFDVICPGYVVVMELIYTSLLRPKEISRIQIKQINLAEHYIFMPGEKTKNGYSRYAFLSDELCILLRPLIKDINKEWYLIGLGYVPKPEQYNSMQYQKMWDKMRKSLKLPKEMQLYSLRDSGINNMLKAGIDPLTVMQAADHHDLSMTTRYANHADPKLIDTLLRQAPKF